MDYPLKRFFRTIENCVYYGVLLTALSCGTVYYAIRGGFKF